MIEEKAIVVSIDNDKIQVESEVTSTCSSCQQVDNCGNGQVAKAIPTRKLKLNFHNDFNLSIGDGVLIGIPERKLLLSAWQVYLLPIIGLIISAGLGQLLSFSLEATHELYTILFGVLGGFIGFKLAYYFQNRLDNQENLSPSLLRKLPESIKVVEIQL